MKFSLIYWHLCVTYWLFSSPLCFFAFLNPPLSSPFLSLKVCHLLSHSSLFYLINLLIDCVHGDMVGCYLPTAVFILSACEQGEVALEWDSAGILPALDLCSTLRVRSPSPYSLCVLNSVPIIMFKVFKFRIQFP